MTLTPEQQHILLHTLGLDWKREPYRNYFVACPGHDDLPHLEALVAAGLMEQRRRPGFLPEDDAVFSTTDAGRELALSLLPKVPRDRSRYLRWLNMRDVDADLTFGEFLRRRMYEDGA